MRRCFALITFASLLSLALASCRPPPACVCTVGASDAGVGDEVVKPPPLTCATLEQTFPEVMLTFRWCYAHGDLAGGALVVANDGSWLRASRDHRQVVPASFSRLLGPGTGRTEPSPQLFAGPHRLGDVWFGGLVRRNALEGTERLLKAKRRH